MEKQRKDEQEREILLKAAKVRSTVWLSTRYSSTFEIFVTVPFVYQKKEGCVHQVLVEIKEMTFYCSISSTRMFRKLVV